MIQRNIGVSNVYTFSHSDFKGVEFYAAKQYMNLTQEGKEEDFFVSDEEEEYDEVLTVSELPLLAEKSVCGAEISYLLCLASGHNSNLTSNDMTDIRLQVIVVDNNNDNDPPKTLYPKIFPCHNWKRRTVGYWKE